MEWKFEFSKSAKKSLEKLPSNITKRILNFLHERLATKENPRDLGDALKGPKLKEFWKYRVGGYRIIVEIKDKELLILVVRIGDRKEIYKS